MFDFLIYLQNGKTDTINASAKDELKNRTYNLVYTIYMSIWTLCINKNVHSTILNNNRSSELSKRLINTRKPEHSKPTPFTEPNVFKTCPARLSGSTSNYNSSGLRTRPPDSD